MLGEIKELWRFRGLLWQLVRRDLKVRYKNSRFGFLWSITPALMQVAVLTFAFKNVGMAADFPSYSAFVLVAMIPYTYFQTAILDASQSILIMYGVIKKVYLPREIIPLASAISNFIHFMLSWLVFFVYLTCYLRAPLLPTMLWFPYLVLVQFMLVTAIGMLVACLNVFYEDIKYIAQVLLNLSLFLLPIMYLSERVLYSNSLQVRGSSILRTLYMWNPMTALINGYRKALLEAPARSALGGHASLPIDVGQLLATGAICFGLLVLSYAYFNSRKWQFVERP